MLARCPARVVRQSWGIRCYVLPATTPCLMQPAAPAASRLCKRPLLLHQLQVMVTPALRQVIHMHAAPCSPQLLSLGWAVHACHSSRVCGSWHSCPAAWHASTLYNVADLAPCNANTSTKNACCAFNTGSAAPPISTMGTSYAQQQQQQQQATAPGAHTWSPGPVVHMFSSPAPHPAVVDSVCAAPVVACLQRLRGSQGNHWPLWRWQQAWRSTALAPQRPPAAQQQRPHPPAAAPA